MKCSTTVAISGVYVSCIRNRIRGMPTCHGILKRGRVSPYTFLQFLETTHNLCQQKGPFSVSICSLPHDLTLFQGLP